MTDAKVTIGVEGTGEVYIGNDIVTGDTLTIPIGGSVYVFAKPYPDNLFQKWRTISEKYGTLEFKKNPITFSVQQDFLIQAVFTPSSLKAVQFSSSWANVMSDFELKAIAKVAILEMGDELASEPVYREGGYAYVVFKPSPVKFVEFNILIGLTNLVKAIVGWLTKNPGKAVTLLAVLGLSYWGISIVDWKTKVEEAKIAISDTIKAGIKEILESSIPEADKVKLITLLLEKNFGTDKEPTDWGTIVLLGVGILAAAYLAQGFIGGKK